MNHLSKTYGGFIHCQNRHAMNQQFLIKTGKKKTFTCNVYPQRLTRHCWDERLSLFYWDGWVLGHFEMYLCLSTGINQHLCLSTTCRYAISWFKYITNIWLFIPICLFPQFHLKPDMFLDLGCDVAAFPNSLFMRLSTSYWFLWEWDLLWTNRLCCWCCACQIRWSRTWEGRRMEGEWKDGVWWIWPQYQET